MIRVQREWVALHAKYPLLKPPIKKENNYIITGELPVIDYHGKIWDTFFVQIDISSDYPQTLPTITETQGRIFRSAAWHINDDYTCCVGTFAEQYRKLHGRMHLLNWVDEFAVPFLANYIYKKEKGIYYNGEWSHGRKGIYEDYAQLYGITPLAPLIRRLRFCSDRERPNNNELCFCGSGKKYKRCYLQNKEAHRFNIPKMVIWNDVSRLMELY